MADRPAPDVRRCSFIEDVIDHHPLRPQPGDAPDPEDDAGSPPDEQPPPIDADEDWPWLDDPVPGDPEYDATLDDLRRSFDAMDLDELARRHCFADDDQVQAR